MARGISCAMKLDILAAFVVSLGAGLGAVQGVLAGSVPDTCNILNAALPGKVIFPNSPNYAVHNSYWSNRQADLTPDCFVTPAKTSDVVVALKILKENKTPFTVKSGGHVPFPSSNIETGVTIDLGRLKELRLLPGDKALSVGPGNRWIDVAAFLDPKKLAVVGGRLAPVGVGGLILGGGISWFSGERGWACDNVLAYEIVLASGEVVIATPKEHPDLYWALRGGGAPNFGVVTRFEIVVFPQGDLWFKDSTYPANQTSEVTKLFSEISVDGLAKDRKGHPAIFFTYDPSSKAVLSRVLRWYTAVPPTGTVPKLFQPLEPIPELSSLTVTGNVSFNLLAYPDPPGFRKGWWDTTVSAKSPEFLQTVARLYGSWVETNFLSQPGMIAFVFCQPIMANTIKEMQKNGGNVLGLDPSQGTLMKVTTYVTWQNQADDAWVAERGNGLVAQIQDAARRGGLSSNFIYMNYAERTQDVYGGYGKKNTDRLRSIAKKYDPSGFFAKQWKGYFKL